MWDKASKTEKCKREDSFIALYQLLGDKAAQDELREKEPNKFHCKWLMRDSNACEVMPEGIPGAVPGAACPHNVYASNPDLFEDRNALSGTIERLMRLTNAADAHLLSESDLDPVTATELLAARTELERLRNEREREAYEESKHRSEIEREKPPELPLTMGSGKFKLVE